MDDMHLGWAWGLWLLSFVGLEWYAIKHRKEGGKGGSLSKWTRWAMGFTGPVKWLRWVFYAFALWFPAHISGLI